MKSLKTIIIAGVVLVVFVIATIVITHIPQSSSPEVSTEEETTTSKETVYVVNNDAAEMVHFTVLPTEREVSEDTAYAYAKEELDVVINKTEEENGGVTYTYDVSPDPGKFEYNSSMMRSMTYTLSSISAKSLVEKDAKDISAYGLDEPTAVVKTYYADGTEVDIMIGSQAPVDEDYYCMTNLSNDVYTIGSYVDSLIVRRPIEYRDIQLFPVYEEEEAYTNIEWICITDRDENVVEVQLDLNLENEYNTEKSQYVMLQPYQVSGNTSTIQSYIVDSVATLSLGGIIDDITEDEYAQYGFNHPAKLEMRDLAGNEVHLLVGDLCANAEYTYCMVEGTDTLIYCPTTAFSWIGVNFVQYMLRTVWSYQIENLESVDIQIGDDHYDMQVDHYIKQNANGNDVDGVTGTLNGQEIIETNVRRLFIKCLYFRIIDNLTEEEKKTAEKDDAYATITINLMDDESHVLELIPISDRKYALRLDGEAEYYCNKKSLESLSDSLGYVLDGDELPLNFS